MFFAGFLRFLLYFLGVGDYVEGLFRLCSVLFNGFLLVMLVVFCWRFWGDSFYTTTRNVYIFWCDSANPSIVRHQK